MDECLPSTANGLGLQSQFVPSEVLPTVAGVPVRLGRNLPYPDRHLPDQTPQQAPHCHYAQNPGSVARPPEVAKPPKWVSSCRPG